MRCLFTPIYLLIIIAVFGYTNTFASHNPKNEVIPVITGMIKSNLSEPIIGAHITIDGTLIGTTSDLNGQFNIVNIKPGTYSVRISAIGYKTITREITLDGNSPITLDIIYDEDEVVFPEVLITGKNDRIFSKIPGSVSFINTKEIKNINPISGNEVFRRTPGVHVVDEEGAGMRANIGIRGLDPDRSRSVLVLEDGIPVALAPYGEPEMYYTPPIDRMSGIEILKGAGQILYGPQTIGGVINYLTANPPAEASGKIRLQAANGGYINGLINYGNTIGKTGYQISLLKKRADKLAYTGFDITDVNAKLLFNYSQKSALSIKLGFYNEVSDATYIGLTQTMYEKGGQDFVHMAPDDLLSVRRYSMSVHHDLKINDKTKLKSTAFAYTTTRDWRRQDFVSNTNNNNKPSNWTGVTWGDESIPGGAIYMRNQNAHRNRSFEVVGVESNLERSFSFFSINHKLKTGARFMHEKADEQRINGTKANASSGALVEDEERPGNALSIYAQNVSEISSQFELHYGVRLEHFSYGRDIFRRTFAVGGQNVLRDTFLTSNNHVRQLIPGGGFNWKPNQKVNVFGGVHMGFAPPRTKDAISNNGEVYNLGAEKSINTELGVRADIAKGIHAELTAFHMNFSNQIIPVSESSGGTGAGLVNGGETVHQGIEGAVTFDISQMLGWTKNALTINTNTTYTDAHFEGDRQQGGELLSGNATPYAPNLLINSAITFETYSGLGIRFASNYVGDQYTDELNTVIASPDGRTGLIPTYHTIDGNVFYQIKPWNTRFSIGIKNITDERYIVSRRPQGIRLGLPRLVTFGAELTF